MSASAQCDFIIDRGADFFVEVYWTDYANNPVSVVSPMRMEIRSGTGQLQAELVYIDDLPDGMVNPGITFNSESGLIQLQMVAKETDKLVPGIFNYDLFVTYSDAQNNANLRQAKLLYGKVEVRGKVTKNL